MRSWIALGVIAGALLAAPAAFAGDTSSPADQSTCQQQQTGNTVAGAAVGAVVGGVIGNNVAGRHHHGAGTALGAVTGGVAGGLIGHNTTNCDPSQSTSEPDTGKAPDDSSQPQSDANAPPMDQPPSK
jgi:uncharacterized membrane protein YebE (DUF533 family)